MDDQGPAVTTVRRASFVSSRLTSLVRVAGVVSLTAILSAHVGSPNVFFVGKAGPYDIRVIVRPPEVVPGVARVTVRTPADVERVAIRPVFWRAGSKGAPSADETRRLEGQGGTFEGSLWLMARGAYSVDVTVDGTQGNGSVLVPVASVATGRLAMSPLLAVLLSVLGVVLLAGLITIVYKAAGESLQEGPERDPVRRRRAQRVAALAIPILALAVFGGARWWGSVDRDYQRTLYRPAPLKLMLQGATLEVQATDTVWQPPGRPSALVPDHGKLMHLFLVRADDARAFAHLHPVPADSSEIPPFRTTLPALPAGRYHVFGDVVHETGFERTLVGSIVLPDDRTERSTATSSDPDDAWFAGDATPERVFRLADGSTMELEIVPGGVVHAEGENTIRIRVRDPQGNPAQLEPYLGMNAHAVVARLDGSVYVHLHPMGTITTAAQQAFLARDRGDTTIGGRLRLDENHAVHGPTTAKGNDSSASVVEFPYAFPRSGSYRLFAQVRRNGRILTAAFALRVAEPAVTP